MGIRISEFPDHEVGDIVGDLFVAGYDQVGNVRLDQHQLRQVMAALPFMSGAGAPDSSGPTFYGGSPSDYSNNDISLYLDTGANTFYLWDTSASSWVSIGGAGSVEGTAVLSTGEAGGTKFLREDGDGTCSWQTPAGGGDLLAANNLSDVANAATAYDTIKQAATDSATGAVELATQAEVDAGTDTTRVITPATLAGTPAPAESTGLLTGGVLSTGAGAAQFSISDGTGQVVSEVGAVTAVSWTGKSNITPANIATNLLTWVAIDSGGNVVESTSAFTAAQRRDNIVLGVVVHVDLVNVDAVNNEQEVAYQPSNSLHDLAASLGFFNISGNVFSANGANLTIDKSAGSIFKMGSNYDSAADDPHRKTLGALTGATFQYRYSDGSNGVTGTAIDPNNLDDGAGGLTALGNNKWSVQRIYSFISNNVKIQRGVESFDSLEQATAGYPEEAYVPESSIAANGLLRGWLIVKKGAAALNGAEAKFIAAPKFGEETASAVSPPAGESQEVVISARKGSVGTITAGQVVYASGYNTSENLVEVELADADGAGTMPAIGIARDTITDAATGTVVFSGRLLSQNTVGYSVGDALYVSTTAGTLTNTKPTGTADIQTVGRVLYVDATAGVIQVVGAGRTNDTPNQLAQALDVNGNEITGGPIDLHSTTDVTVELGDAAGLYKLSVQDSSPAEVASIDSDGNLTIIGDVTLSDTKAIKDTNGNALMVFSLNASAVNYLEVDNASTGFGPVLTVGGETNVDLRFQAKGTGNVEFLSPQKWQNDVDADGQLLSNCGNITMNGAATVDNRDVSADGAKLDGIEAGADVTDATNVDDAGAVMNSDTSTAAMSFVVDEDDMSSDSATKVPTQQSVKAYTEDIHHAFVLDGADSAIAVNLRSNQMRATHDMTLVAWRMFSHSDADRTAALNAGAGGLSVKLQKSSYGTPYSVTDLATMTISATTAKNEATGLSVAVIAGDVLFVTVTTADGTTVLVDGTLEFTRS